MDRGDTFWAAEVLPKLYGIELAAEFMLLKMILSNDQSDPPGILIMINKRAVSCKTLSV